MATFPCRAFLSAVFLKVSAAVVAPIAMNYRPDLCLDLADGNTLDGNAVQIVRCDGNESQNWEFVGSEIRYGADPTKCVDAGGMTDGENLILWDCNSLAQQEWAYNPDVARLSLSSFDSMCMGIDGSTADSTPVKCMSCRTIWSQMWTLAAAPVTTLPPPPAPPPSPTPTPPSSQGYALAVTANADYCLDAAGGSSEDGTPIQLWKCLGTPNQQWMFKDGALVSGLDSSKCVDSGPDHPNGFTIMLWACNGYPQQWWGYDDTYGTIYLTDSAASTDASQCLDIPGAYIANGNQVWVWDCLATEGQQFTKVTGNQLVE